MNALNGHMAVKGYCKVSFKKFACKFYCQERRPDSDISI